MKHGVGGMSKSKCYKLQGIRNYGESWLPTKNKVQQQNGLKITGSKLNVYQMLHLSPNGLLILSISIKEWTLKS